jgi:adenine-specific DNA-methyltransferase
MTEQKQNSTPWGPANPHPLSRLKTELVWEGKYDEYGNRRPVRLPASPLPLQRIEAIDEPHDRELAVQLSLFDEDAFHQQAHRDDFRNLLLWGDNKLAMTSLLERFRGKVDLIYIDPPFDVGADFTVDVQIGEEKDKVQKEQSILEAVAYRDTWGKGTDSYLHMMYERLVLMRDLLDEKGVIAVHVGDKVQSPLQMVMSDVFGDVNYRNCIIVRRGTKNVQSQFKEIRALTVGNDYVLLYSKAETIRFPKLTLPGAHPQPGKWDTFWRGTDRPTMRYELFGITPTSGQWRWSETRARKAKKNYEEYVVDYSGEEELDAYYSRNLEDGQDLDFVRLGPDSTVQYFVPPRDYKLASSVWFDIKTRGASSNYATEKNEQLLEVITGWLTHDGDLVADFFCGSGTTLAVAEKLGRRWIGVDLGRYAIHTTRKRLIQVQRELHAANQPYRSFDVYNLGRYERQWWQMERLQGADVEHRRIVLQFYKAAPLANPPNPLLHGKKGGAYVHVDQIDSIFSEDELRAVAGAAQAAGGRELHCLAWEFEMELALKKQAVEAETGLAVRLKYIPREIMEPNRTECQFFEAGYLEARAIRRGDKTDVQLVRFAPALAEAPEKEMAALRERAVQSPFDFIDFWAVDFEWREGKPFEHHWQDFRTRKDRSLKTRTDIGWQYEGKGKHRICVKVIDVFGVDTTTIVEVEG